MTFKKIMGSKIILVLGLSLNLFSRAHANCTTPEFVFCSISIGSKDELKVFRRFASTPANNVVPATVSGFDSDGNFVSHDGCILFHEFVKPTHIWHPDRNSYTWHESMLESPSIPGAPAGAKCSLLLVSGHHDAYNSAGEYPSGYHLRRNQFVYSNQHYTFEKAFPDLTGPLTSPPDPLPAVEPGPRLLLSQLARTKPVCNQTFNQRDYPPGGLSANSGNVLLSDLLAVYLFACNFSAGDGVSADAPAVRFPTAGMNASVAADKLIFQEFSFQQRAQVLFSSAIKLYTFPLTAPLGAIAAPYVVSFLKNHLKRDLYNNDANFLTLYLRDLRSQKQGRLPTSALMAGGSLLRNTFAACRSRLNPECSCIRTADGTACIEQCALGTDEKATLKRQYCDGLSKFHELAMIRDDATLRVPRRLKLMRNVFLHGAAQRFNESQVSQYDFSWAF